MNVPAGHQPTGVPLREIWPEQKSPATAQKIVANQDFLGNLTVLDCFYFLVFHTFVGLAGWAGLP